MTMKSQDIVVLMKLASLQEQEFSGSESAPSAKEDPFSVRGLESSLGISKTEVSASLKRSIESGLAIRERASNRVKLNRRDLYNFIVYGLKFVFPAKPGAMTRGISTAFAAPVLEGLVMSAGEYIYVWPHAHGKEMGQSVEPLFKSVPEAIEKDARLYEYLALIDAIRLGKQRETNIATKQLEERLLLT